MPQVSLSLILGYGHGTATGHRRNRGRDDLGGTETITHLELRLLPQAADAQPSDGDRGDRRRAARAGGRVADVDLLSFMTPTGSGAS